MAKSTRVPLSLSVNGEAHDIMVEPRRTLLDVLRQDLALTGAKKVCDMGNCGACTVMVDGKTQYACLTLAVDMDGHEITTIEGIGHGNTLDSVQQAFIDEDAFQCGYCTPGQIVSMRAFLSEHPNPTDEELMRSVSGNLCRCGAYQHIARAGRRAVELIAERDKAEV